MGSGEPVPTPSDNSVLRSLLACARSVTLSVRTYVRFASRLRRTSATMKRRVLFSELARQARIVAEGATSLSIAESSSWEVDISMTHPDDNPRGAFVVGTSPASGSAGLG